METSTVGSTKATCVQNAWMKPPFWVPPLFHQLAQVLHRPFGELFGIIKLELLSYDKMNLKMFKVKVNPPEAKQISKSDVCSCSWNEPTWNTSSPNEKTRRFLWDQQKKHVFEFDHRMLETRYLVVSGFKTIPSSSSSLYMWNQGSNYLLLSDILATGNWELDSKYFLETGRWGYSHSHHKHWHWTWEWMA